MQYLEKMPVLREGLWLYASEVTVRVRILESHETWGTGDYEDESSIAENQPTTCYFLAYEMAGSPGNLCNLVPNLPSFEEAVAHAEKKFPNITWQAP